MQFEKCLRRELGVAQKDKAAFIKEFSESDYNAIEAGWKVSWPHHLFFKLLSEQHSGIIFAEVLFEHGVFRGQQQYCHRALQGMVAQLRRFGQQQTSCAVLFSPAGSCSWLL